VSDADTIGRVRSAIITGVRATLVLVEVHRGKGLPRQTIVGLAGSAVRESLERIHAACSQCGLSLRPRRTTINLAPAGFRKSGSGLDLPIALGLLVAEGSVPAARLDGTVCLGELSLDGSARPVAGVLPAAIAARHQGVRRILVPQANGGEAAAVPGIEALEIPSLAAAVSYLRGETELPTAQAAEPSGVQAGAARAETTTAIDLADVQGHALPRRALEIVAAGGHHLLMSGPPGAGKTLLARALPGLLPELSFDEALQVSSVYSVLGGMHGRGLLRTRPFRAPHHSITTAGLVGGGSPLRPGEISLATRGVLFLDEMPEFRRSALEALRQPLEEGHVAISRANESYCFPARFQLVAAMNECPCGRGAADADCACSELEIGRYWKKISGPLLDRIDLFVPVDRVPLRQITGAEPAEGSADVARRVLASRDRQLNCNGGRLNADLPAREVMARCGMSPAALRHARRAADRLGLSARAWYRALRVARTLADLAAAEIVAESHLMEALQYRRPTIRS